MREYFSHDFVKLEFAAEVLGTLTILALAGAGASGKLWLLDISLEAVAGGLEAAPAADRFLLLVGVVLAASAVYIQIDKYTTALLESEG